MDVTRIVGRVVLCTLAFAFGAAGVLAVAVLVGGDEIDVAKQFLAGFGLSAAGWRCAVQAWSMTKEPPDHG